MSAFPHELLARARPRDASEQVRPRWQENARSLGALGGAVGLALLAGFAPIHSAFELPVRLGLGGMAVVLLQVIARQARRVGTWPPEIEEGIGLLRAGDLGAANARLEVVLADARIHPAFRAVALAWRGLICLRHGDPARAQDLWAEVARSGHWRESGLRFAFCGVPGLLALAAAVEGDLPRAQRFLESSPRIGGELGLGSRLLASTYLAARSGDPQAAREMAREHWASAEATLAPGELRALRVLAAFAQTDVQSAVARSWREGARPGWPGELDYLARTWPELGGYLAQHGFGSGDG